MQAIYMRSVRSPGRQFQNGGRYKLAYNPAVDDMDVYSQDAEPDNTHYEYDSFCVATDEEIGRSDEHEYNFPDN